jgi:DNA-binding MarR family transcriptional regulator
MQDDEDGRRIGELLRVPNQAVVAHCHRALNDAGFSDLRAAHMPVIMYIDHPPGGTTITALAERAQMTKQSMGELVGYMEKRGYLERIPAPTDKRAKIVRLTARGWEAHETAPRVVLELEERWAERLGPEKMRQLRHLLKDLIATLET